MSGIITTMLHPSFVFQETYIPPSDPSLWYAPSTLLYDALLLAIFALLVWIIVGFIYPLKPTPEEERREAQAATYEDWQYAHAIRYSLYRFTGGLGIASFIFWGILFLSLVAAGYPLNSEYTLNYKYHDGYALACITLAVPTLVLFGTSFLVWNIAAKYGTALPQTGIFSVIWLLTAGLGCAGGAFIVSAFHGSSQTAGIWFLTGVVFSAVGLLRGLSRHNGETVFVRTRHAVSEARKRYALKAFDTAPEAAKNGEYNNYASHVNWKWLFLAFLIPVGLFAALIFTTSPPYKDLLLFIYIPTGGIIGLMFIAWYASRGLARNIRWSERGIQVDWFETEPASLNWDELTSVESRMVGRFGMQYEVTWIKTRDNKLIRFDSRYPGYKEFVLAAQMHIWSRENTNSESKQSE
jgi:hypothetical protein